MPAEAHRADPLLVDLEAQQVIERIWRRDPSVWPGSSAELEDRLGWLDCPETMPADLPRLADHAGRLRNAGIAQVLLLGMGGSSLAPEMYARTFGAAPGFPSLTVVDTTDPQAIADVTRSLDASRTAFLVATKSGKTTETLSLFHHFYQATRRGTPGRPGDRFFAITDPGSPLVAVAESHGFAKVFLADATIGGRFSALSLFGLVPAASLGVDVRRLLRSAHRARSRCLPDVPVAKNPAALLAAELAGHARTGRDKLTLVLSPGLAAFGDWLEQLIAESTGKDGKGLLPVVGEPLGEPSGYGDDRLFVRVRLAGDSEAEPGLERLRACGHPVISLEVSDVHELGEQIFVWELAVALIGHLMAIDPFDQPNVESSKRATRDAISSFRATGALPEAAQLPSGPDDVGALLVDAAPGDYVAIHAYLPPEPAVRAALEELRDWIRTGTRCAATIGFGPRFLHSTGQLHKGDAGHGRFLQLTWDAPDDLPVPGGDVDRGPSLTFGVLTAALAHGDAAALLRAGRRVARVHLEGDPAAGVRALTAVLRQRTPIEGRSS